MTPPSSVTDILSAVGSLATAFGLAFTGFQLWLGYRQKVTDFEDTLASEYRALASSLPVEALLGGTLSDEEHTKALDEFYHYFDLSNGQVFLRQIGRVSQRTFKFWSDGMEVHLSRPAFARAWTEIAERAPNDFKELRRLVAEQYKVDPRHWPRPKKS